MRNKLLAKRIISIIVVAIGLLLGGYIGIWLLFVKPIIDCCNAFDTNTLTGIMIGISVLKCIFASSISVLIISIFVWIAKKIGN